MFVVHDVQVCGVLSQFGAIRVFVNVETNCKSFNLMSLKATVIIAGMLTISIEVILAVIPR